MEEEHEELGVGQDWPLPQGSVEHKGAGTRLPETVGAFLMIKCLRSPVLPGRASVLMFRPLPCCMGKACFLSLLA